jgi:type III secretory pathway component EscS
MIEPALPTYAAYEKYHIVELSTALGPLPVERFIGTLLTLIENITSIEDVQTLNFILFVLVFTINMGCITICCCLLACHARRIKNTRGSRLPAN